MGEGAAWAYNGMLAGGPCQAAGERVGAASRPGQLRRDGQVAMASIVLLREIAHGVAPVLQRPSTEILDHFREWIAGRDSP
jgi:hypothetical protein